MKTVKQILEHYNVYSDLKHSDKLKAVSDAGLLDENKLPILKRALQKEAGQLTNAEKKALNEVVETLAESNHLSKFDSRQKMGFPKGDKDVPAVLILKRKAIRVYPDNQKIALYYSDMLDKYFSVPFGPGTEHIGIHMNEAKKEKKDDELDPRYKQRYNQIRKEKNNRSKLRDIASDLASQGAPLMKNKDTGKRGGEFEIARDKNLHQAHLQNISSGKESTAYKIGKKIRARIFRTIALARGAKPDIENIKPEAPKEPKSVQKPVVAPTPKPQKEIKPERLERTPGAVKPPALAGLRIRTPEQTNKRAQEILSKNPKQKFSKGAMAAGAAIVKPKGPKGK